MATHEPHGSAALLRSHCRYDWGEVFQVGPPHEVLNHPIDEFVASFVGVETILEGTVVKADQGSFLTSVGEKKIEALAIAVLGDRLPYDPSGKCDPGRTPVHQATSARNVFPGVVEKVVPMGLYYKVQLQCGFPLIAYITTHSVDSLKLKKERSHRLVQSHIHSCG